jgi:lipoate-protein ligase A
MSRTCLAETVTAREEQHWNDQALATPVATPMLRFWRYRVPGIVLGASQQGLLSRTALENGTEVVVRSAGGTAVLTGPWMLSLSALLPPDHAIARGGPMPAYEWLGTRCCRAMSDLGVARAVATPDRRQADSLAWACFAGLSPWEVTVGARKLVGLAQRRRKNGVLVAAGVLLDSPDWALLCRSMGMPPEHAVRLAASTVSCGELLGNVPDADTVALALQSHLVDTIHIGQASQMLGDGVH